MDKKNLIVFNGPEKHERLINRAKVVCKNFSNEVYGVALMDYVLVEIYNQFKEDDDFYSEQVCAKVHEARSYLEFFNSQE